MNTATSLSRSLLGREEKLQNYQRRPCPAAGRCVCQYWCKHWNEGMAGKGGYIAASSAALLDNISKPVSILRRLRHWRLQAILVLSLSAGLCGVFYAGGGAWPGRSSALLEIRDRNAHDHVALFLSQTARKSQQRWHTKRKFAHALEPQAAQVEERGSASTLRAPKEGSWAQGRGPWEGGTRGGHVGA